MPKPKDTRSYEEKMLGKLRKIKNADEFERRSNTGLFVLLGTLQVLSRRESPLSTQEMKKEFVAGNPNNFRSMLEELAEIGIVCSEGEGYITIVTNKNNLCSKSSKRKYSLTEKGREFAQKIGEHLNKQVKGYSEIYGEF